MPQIETYIDIAQAAADEADGLTDFVVKRAREFSKSIANRRLAKLMQREIEKVVAVQILDGTRQNAGNGTDGTPGVPA